MNFTSPPNLKAYYALVWDLARKIPPGKVASYGQIARMIPPPFGMNFKEYMTWSPRWVGGAMANCPDDVPWQRVINSQGKISHRRGGTINQRIFLEGEGIKFDDRDRIDLKHYGWEGPPEQ